MGTSNNLFVNSGQVSETRLGAKGIESGSVVLKDKDTIRVGSIELMASIGPAEMVVGGDVDVEQEGAVARKLEPELASVQQQRQHTTTGTVGEITRLQRELTAAKDRLVQMESMSATAERNLVKVTAEGAEELQVLKEVQVLQLEAKVNILKEVQVLQLELAQAEAAMGAVEAELVESRHVVEEQALAARQQEQEQGVALISTLRAIKAAGASATVGLAEAVRARKQAEAELAIEKLANGARAEEALGQAAEAKAQLVALEEQLKSNDSTGSAATERAEVAEARVADLEEQVRMRTAEAAAASVMAAAAAASAGQARETLLQGKGAGAASAGEATAAGVWQAAAKADDPEAAVLQALHAQIGNLFEPVIASSRARSAH